MFMSLPNMKIQLSVPGEGSYCMEDGKSIIVLAVRMRRPDVGPPVAPLGSKSPRRTQHMKY